MKRFLLSFAGEPKAKPVNVYQLSVAESAKQI
jgi:hypothetical protein